VAYLRRGLEPSWKELGHNKGASAFDEGRKMSLEYALAYAFEDGEPPSVPRESPAVGSGRTTLTRREREVAVLVARELSNREIADELFVSEHTVATHVHRILGKLGLRSRTQIAAWMIGQQAPQ
jgi:non-specific serine/threonine protein kinase